MKKIVIYYILTIIAFNNTLITHAQVSSLHQNFDVACVTTPYFASNWLLYNPIPATALSGAWTCTANEGNHTTPGMECSGYYSGSYHLDTSYLITPMLNFYNDIGHHIYLRFDSRTNKIYNGSTIAVIRTPLPDSAVVGSIYNLQLSGTIYPAFGSADSIGWVTHEVDITPSELYGNFYLTFMYTSTATSGSIWYMDNVIIDTQSMKLNVPDLSNQPLPITIIGMSTRNEITIAYSAPVAGQYHLAIYDMMGRELYTELLNAKSGTATYSIKGINLHNGMYCIKLGDGITYGITKVIIQ